MSSKDFANIDSSIWGQNTVIENNVAIDSNVLIGHDVHVSSGVKIKVEPLLQDFLRLEKLTYRFRNSIYTKV